MKKRIAVIVVLIVLIVVSIVIIKFSSNSKHAFLDQPKINTCSTNKNEFSLQIRYFTDYEVKTEEYENFASLTNGSSGVDIAEQEIELSTSQSGINEYTIALTMEPYDNDATFGISLKLDKEYTINEVTNKNYKRDPNDVFRGMDYINMYDKNLHTNVFFDKTFDFNKLKVNTVLNEITSNIITKDNEGNPLIRAQGNMKAPQIVGYIYTYDNTTYCADNEIQYREYTIDDIKEQLK